MSDTSIGELPPSAKLVYKVLEYRGPQTQKELAEATMLSTRTVRYALEQLDAADVVDAEIHIPDARQKKYSLRDDATTDARPGVE